MQASLATRRARSEDADQAERTQKRRKIDDNDLDLDEEAEPLASFTINISHLGDATSTHQFPSKSSVSASFQDADSRPLRPFGPSSHKEQDIAPVPAVLSSSGVNSLVQPLSSSSLLDGSHCIGPLPGSSASTPIHLIIKPLVVFREPVSKFPFLPSSLLPPPSTMSGRFFSRSAAEEWGGVPTTLLQECNTLRAMVTRQSAVIEQLKAEKAGPGDPYSSQREVPIPKPSTTGNLREAAKIDSQTTLTGLYDRLRALVTECQLNNEATYPEQDPQKLNALFIVAKERWTIFGDYVNNWLTKEMVRVILANRRRSVRASRRGGQDAPIDIDEEQASPPRPAPKKKGKAKARPPPPLPDPAHDDNHIDDHDDLHNQTVTFDNDEFDHFLDTSMHEALHPGDIAPATSTSLHPITSTPAARIPTRGGHAGGAPQAMRSFVNLVPVAAPSKPAVATASSLPVNLGQPRSSTFRVEAPARIHRRETVAQAVANPQGLTYVQAAAHFDAQVGEERRLVREEDGEVYGDDDDDPEEEDMQVEDEFEAPGTDQEGQEDDEYDEDYDALDYEPLLPPALVAPLPKATAPRRQPAKQNQVQATVAVAPKASVPKASTRKANVRAAAKPTTAAPMQPIAVQPPTQPTSNKVAGRKPRAKAAVADADAMDVDCTPIPQPSGAAAPVIAPTRRSNRGRTEPTTAEAGDADGALLPPIPVASGSRIRNASASGSRPVSRTGSASRATPMGSRPQSRASSRNPATRPAQ